MIFTKSVWNAPIVCFQSTIQSHMIACKNFLTIHINYHRPQDLTISLRTRIKKNFLPWIPIYQSKGFLIHTTSIGFLIDHTSRKSNMLQEAKDYLQNQPWISSQKIPPMFQWPRQWQVLLTCSESGTSLISYLYKVSGVPSRNRVRQLLHEKFTKVIKLL